MRNVTRAASRVIQAGLAVVLLIAAAPVGRPERLPADAVGGSRLKFEQIVADSTSFDVNAVLIVGPKEALLYDAQYHVADAERLADRIAATGKHLTAIFISHPDHDHYSGTAVIVKRFPGTPVYMTPTALAEFKKTAPRDFGNEKSRNSARMADSLVTPVAVPSNRLTVDGETVEVFPDLQGDVLLPTNSVLWIPSARTVLAGDIIFNQVHPWFGASTPETRAAWLLSLKRIADLKPLVVIAGHKRTVDLPDSPETIDKMAKYLKDFDAGRKAFATGPELVKAIKGEYPEWAVAGLLQYSAMVAYRSATPPPAATSQGSSSSQASYTGPFEATGVYDFVLTIPDRPQLAGRIVIKGTGGKFEGSIAPESAPEPVAFESVNASGGRLVLGFTIPNAGPASIDVAPVSADSLVGKFTGPMATGQAVLKRVR